MFEPWREDLFKEFGRRRHQFPATYRDEWSEELEKQKQVIWKELQEQANKLRWVIDPRFLKSSRSSLGEFAG